MTPFAKLSRQYRKDKGFLLGDVADKIGCSPSFLSQVEAGNKAIPVGLVGKIGTALGLTLRERGALERAGALSAREFRIALPKDARAQDRQIAQRLSLGFARMSPTKKKQILDILKDESHA